ncbi:MAG: cell division protein ZapA [Burkholderiaceae bacterium]|nr:cell division protein ZapA [Burkholderiaceae bacterium]
MAKSTQERIEVLILDRSYQLSCTPDDKPMLLECVALVDARMRQVKASSKLQGLDRIAVMAALTLARDVLAGSPGADQGERDQALKKITAISQVLDSALMPQEKLF